MRKVFLLIAVLGAGVALGAGIFALAGRSKQPESPLPQPVSVAIQEPRCRDATETGNAAGFAGVVNEVSASVVNILTVKTSPRRARTLKDEPFFDYFKDYLSPDQGAGEPSRKRRDQGFGSGVVVSADGYILTNYHVVAEAERIQVTLRDRKVYDARLIGADAKTDTAVLKIEAAGLATVPWGDSSALNVGDFVLAIGNPYGLGHTVTMGIVSATGRTNMGVSDFEEFIQTDAAINPGNSGGPLINARGELVGINTAIFTRNGGYQGIGFAIPSNMIRQILDPLVREGRVVRGWAGMALQDLSPELARGFGYGGTGGALISDIDSGGPSDRANLRVGDIVVAFDERAVADSVSLRTMIALTPPGEPKTFRLFRESKETVARVMISSQPGGDDRPRTAVAYSGEDEALAGLSVTQLTVEIAAQVGVSRQTTGVVITYVEDGTPASIAGLRRGDVIMEVERRPIRSVVEYRSVSSEIPERKSVLMYINRSGRRFFVTLPVS